MDQNTQVAILIAVAAVLILAAILIAVNRKRRSRRLKEQFGSEYDRAVLARGNPAKAEAELIHREKRVQSFTIKSLTPAARDRFQEEWLAVQARFVDDPALAVTEADSLVNRVMTARGYPMSDFEQRAADISVTYPTVVENYRAAGVIAARYRRGEASTEDLRQAMVHYRSLFDELLDVPATAARAVPYQRAS